MNGSRSYYIGSYYEDLVINATIKNGTLEYQADFTKNIEKAISLTLLNGTIDTSGIRGRMAFEVLIGNAIGITGQKRFLNVLIQGEADLDVISCDFTLPMSIDLVEAKNEGQDMQKRGAPYRVDTSIAVTPLQPFGRHLYLEWNIPSAAPLLATYPYNVLVAAFVSLFVGWISRYSYDNIKARRQKQRMAPVKGALLQRIEKDLKLLAVWIEMIAYEKPNASNELVERIKLSKNAFIESTALGSDVISPDMKQASLELDKRLDVLINSASIRKHYPDDMWFKEIDETLSQLLVLFRLLGNTEQSIVIESWLEVLHLKSCSRK
jgi:hypothetical protein